MAKFLLISPPQFIRGYDPSLFDQTEAESPGSFKRLDQILQRHKLIF